MHWNYSRENRVKVLSIT